jgi:hypothetical protein
LAPGEARAAALHLTAVVRGTAQISIDIRSAHKTVDGRSLTEAELAKALSELIDPHNYPALAAVHAAETSDNQPGCEQQPEEATLPAELSFGVDRFLDGVEIWAAAKIRGAGGSQENP